MRPGEDPVRVEYDRLARDYDSRWRRYVDRSCRETLARLAVPATARVLDVGCGTGLLLDGIARTVPASQLAGVDLSPAMLAVAADRLPPEVDLRAARAEALPFADATFDAVVSNSAFHFVPAPAEALAEMHRVLRPGGRVVISDWCRDYLSGWLLDRWLHWTNDAHYRTWSGAALARMMRTAGLADVAVERYRIDWWWGLMTLTAQRPA